MKKHLLKVIVCCLLASCKSYSQPESEVIGVFQKDFNHVDFHQLIFLERELIEFCRDSAGQKQFYKATSNFRHSLKQSDPDTKTKKVIFLVLEKRIKEITLQFDQSKQAADFIIAQIEDLKPDFAVNKEVFAYLMNNSNRDLATKEACDVGISKYVLFVYNPQIYADVFRSNKAISPDGHISFPYNCSIKDFDTAEVLRKKMQVGLVKLLDDYSDPDLQKIKKDINEADLAGSYD